MTEHSVLAPSSAARRVACPGSRALEAKYPDDGDSVYAREGHAAHWVACEVVVAAIEEHNGAEIIESLPARAPNGELITQAMLEGADLYFDAIATVLRDCEGFLNSRELHLEARVDISTIHPEMWGTPDAWYYSRRDNQLHIWDYKFGFGFVEVFENWQLIAYAAGILETLGINGLQDQHLRVHMHIVQPRSYHPDGNVRTWSLAASDLRGYFNVLRNAEAQAMEPSARCNPNPECNYCRGRHACEALQRATAVSMDVSQLNVPFELNAMQVGFDLRNLKRAADLLDARITGLSEQALSMIQRGERVPGFKAEQSAGREVWKVPVADVVAMGELLEIDLAKPTQLITPKQALAKGLSVEIVKAMAETPHGAMKLVPEDESKLRKIFGGES